jgi:hypothetical protein
MGRSLSLSALSLSRDPSTPKLAEGSDNATVPMGRRKVATKRDSADLPAAVRHAHNAASVRNIHPEGHRNNRDILGYEPHFQTGLCFALRSGLTS